MIRLVGALLVEVNDEMISADKRYIAAAKQTLAERLGVPPGQFSDVEMRQVVDAYLSS